MTLFVDVDEIISGWQSAELVPANRGKKPEGTCIGPSGAHDPFRSQLGWECANCEEALIKCDYCPEVEVTRGRVPENWLSCRINSAPREDGLRWLISGPTACPFHYEQLKLVFGGK